MSSKVKEVTLTALGIVILGALSGMLFMAPSTDARLDLEPIRVGMVWGLCAALVFVVSFAVWSSARQKR